MFQFAHPWPKMIKMRIIKTNALVLSLDRENTDKRQMFCIINFPKLILELSRYFTFPNCFFQTFYKVMWNGLMMYTPSLAVEAGRITAGYDV